LLVRAIIRAADALSASGWLANKAGYDPAAVSDPLVTTVKHVTALVIYFGLTTALLQHLL